MPSRLRRTVAALISTFVVAASFPAAIAAATEAPSGPTISHPWIDAAPDPAALQDAIAANGDKIPVEFGKRLRFVLADGTLRVMVALAERDAAIEAFAGSQSVWMQWYGDDPRYLARVTQAQLATLLEADFVTFVEPDYPIKNFMATSTLDVHARSLTNDGTGVWSYTPGPNGGSLVSDVPGLTADQATGKGVTVAITDSGIDRTHRDFGGWNCAAGPMQPCDSRIRGAITIDHIVGAGVDPGPALPTTEAASGHGTHVAGTIAGNAYYTRFDPTPDVARYGADGHNFGIAPQASLISTKNGDSQWAGLSSFGLQWQLDNAEALDIRVSSNSWGCLGGCSFNGSSATAQLLKDMYEAGIVVVFAAGNDGTATKGLSNAQSPYALGVANYDDANDRLASSSSRGTDNSLPAAATWTPEGEPVNGEPRPDVAAPGTGIWSARTLTGGTSAGHGRVVTSDITGGSGSGLVEYVQMSGTSMATPHVSGAAAVMFSACPTATPLDVMRAVMVGADPTEVKSTDNSRTATPSEVGYGALEIRRGLDWLMSQPACGGTGGDTDPTPDPTPTVDPSPTSEPTSDPGTSTRYYFHSPSGSNNMDQIDETATFDTKAPTFDEYSFAYDVPGAQNVAGGFEVVDPEWSGVLAEPAGAITVDFWGETLPDSAVSTANYTVRVSSNGGDYVELLPAISRDDVESGVVNIKHTFTKMMSGGQEVPLALPAGPLTFTIRGTYTVNDAVTEIRFDSKTYPSGFSAGSSAPDPDPTVDPTPTDDPTNPPPPAGERGTYPATPNDPYFPDGDLLDTLQQWAPQKIQAPQAWQEAQSTGYGVTVAVLDTGVDKDHEDLQCPGKLVPGADMVNDGDGTDDKGGHGTHVAGIVGACTNNETGIAGTAPDASIMPIQVLDAEGNGTVDGIADGIRTAADRGAHVINMSLSLGVGVPGSGAVGWIPGFVPEIDAAVEYANSKGAVLVAAAGNESLPLCEYPAIAEDVVCVGATDNRDLKTWYSGFPNKPDLGPSLVAPGGNEVVFCDVADETILSLYPAELDGCDEDGSGTANEGYRTANGTSMAAPHVSGVAALVYDRLAGVRSVDNQQAVIDAIISSAKDLGVPGYDPVFGYGRLDALAAVRAVDPVVIEPTPTEEPPAATTSVSFTDQSATSAQHSDDALIEARLTNAETGEPLAGQDLTFELVGAEGTRSWTVTTGDDGVAGDTILIGEAPGSYTLNVRYAGLEGDYVGSADLASFVVAKDDSTTVLEVLGDRNARQLRSTTTDSDSGSGLAGAEVSFSTVDGIQLGTATTNENGVAVLAVEKKYTKKETGYEARFGGDPNYQGSSDRRQQ